ncbi:MAG: hypothetical protein WCI61_02140 [Chloroflexota bacterium]
MPDSNRLEREIEEILGKIEQFPDARTRRRRSANRALQQFGAAVSDRLRGFVRQISRFSISQVMLLSFILILGSLFFRRAAPAPMTWVLYAGIILFVSSFAISMFGGGRGGSNGPPKWRGRTVQYQSSAPLSDRLRRWWNSRTRR